MDLAIASRTALVTGSHRGTGAVIANALEAEGVQVVRHGFEAGSIPANAGPAVYADITDSAQCEELIDTLRAQDIHVDILVNNYGTASRGRWLDTDENAWLAAYQHNVLSAVRLTQALLPGMQERGFGRIINLGTVGSSRPNPVMPHYYAAKTALAGATMSLARAVDGDAVTVNLVSPGLILTDEVKAQYMASGERNGWGSTWEEIEPHVAKDIPLGRIARREEVADLVCFLASQRASFIHGQNIGVDGGSLSLVN